MLTEELLKKVRRIELVSKKSSSEILAGEYHSAFKGRGMEFAEVREYFPGDDVRSIDWNVSSRTGKLHVKQFIEERELTVILAIDLSGSQNFWSEGRSKREVAAEIAAMVAFTAMLNNDKVGLLIFTGEVEHFVPPKKDRTHLLRIITEILSYKPKGKGTSIENALGYLNRVIKKQAILFLISDFMDEGFSRSMKVTGRKHDLIAVRIGDPRESELPGKGIFILEDCETGEEVAVDFSSLRVREHFKHIMAETREVTDELCRKYGIDLIDIFTGEQYEKKLFDFFIKRKRMSRR